MLSLYLLRHAKAASPPALEDRLRPLTNEGLAQADALGRVMMERGFAPEFILCSPAIRAVQTQGKISTYLDGCPVSYSSRLYNSTQGQIFEEIKGAGKSLKSLMVISHNPAIHTLAGFLAGTGTEENMARLAMEYRECTLAVLECQADDWLSLQPYENILTSLLIHGQDF